MRDPDEPRADGALPMPPRPEADVLLPRLRPAQVRRELQRLASERERAQRELGELVVEMSQAGALDPAVLADHSAAVRSVERQIAVLETALAGKPPAPPPGSTRRATVLAALLAVAVIGALAGAWIERERADPAAAPVTVPTVVTETVIRTVPAPATMTPARTTAAASSHGGRAVALPG
jgi:hypothetical protein